MRKCLILMWSLCIGCGTFLGQTPEAPRQSARQALIEMFVGKSPDAFTKHLPEAARKALIHKGETPESSFVLRLSQFGRQITASEHVETFDAGPNILVTEQSGGHQRAEIAVERDSLMGEEDEIELSLHLYKDGQPQFFPVVPQLIFTLKQEKEIWRVIEVTAAAHVPLTDPDYLKGVRKQQDEATEAAAQMRVAGIAAAEARYAAKHPDRGYTCAMSNLAAPDPEGTADDGSYYIPNQADGESNGYRFTLSGCDGNPSSKYRILAEPADPDADMKTFCADESGGVKSLVGAKSSSCFSHGKAVNAQVTFTID